MKRWIEWFAENSVAANLLMVLLIVGGVISGWNLRKEVTPEIDTDIILAQVPYPGATPAEIEESICARIEEEVEGLSGIKKVTSTAAEGMGSVMIELMLGSDAMKLLNDVKTRIDAIPNFPEKAEKPIVQEIDTNKQVVTLAVVAETDEASLKALGERVRDEVAALPRITKTALVNVRPYEVSIEVSETRLEKYGLAFDEVVAAVRASSIDLPAGSIKSSGGEILLRSLGQAFRGAQFEQIVLRSEPDGRRILLGDVADVRDAFEDQDLAARFNGRPAVMIQVFRVGEQSAFEIVGAVEDYLVDARQRLPDGAEIVLWRNDVDWLEKRLGLLLRNGWQGFILVFATLALFLRFQLAFWVTLGIPFAFLGALWLLPALNVTINMISLFGFIIVLGIVVDDAIVVGENVYTDMEKGGRGLAAAKAGTIQMIKPVSFAVLTTIAAFLVMLGIPGIYGQFARNIPLVVIACLCFSLIEAFFVLPAHLKHMDLDRPPPRLLRPIARAWTAFQGLFQRFLDWSIKRTYAPALEILLRWRYATLAAGLTVVMVSLGVGALLPSTFFPSIDSEFMSAGLEMPLGTSFDDTRRALDRVEGAARELQAELDRDRDVAGEGSVFKYVSTTVGAQPFAAELRQNSGEMVGTQLASHLAEVLIQTAPSETRGISSAEIVRRWREKAGAIPGANKLEFKSSIMNTGKPIHVRLAHSNIDSLRAAGTELEDWLRSRRGTIDISDTLIDGKRELRLRIKPEAEALGLRQADLARQVRQAYYGEEAQRVQRGRDDLKVMVRYSEAERRTLASLEAMHIRTAAGAEVPLRTVADLDWGRGPATITRFNRKRSMDVLADVDVAAGGNEARIKAAMEAEVLPRLLRHYPGLSWSYEGGAAEQASFMSGMIVQGFFSLILIFALLAIPLRSYLQPLIIMSVIPFGVTGAIWGHVIMGAEFSMMSFIGLIALTGIVVNDSLVLVDFVNRFREEGEGTIAEAIHQAGIARFRPILLTSLTTFAGLLPLMFENDMQAQFLIPAAISLAFGVLFATAITLVLVPCLYMVLEDARRVLGRVGRFLRWLYGDPEEEKWVEAG